MPQEPSQGPAAQGGRCGAAHSQHHFPGSLAGSSAAALSRAKLLRQLPWPFSSC